ncbi:hypothetical protein [Capnocytophaga bilenii]|uniref:hypothetical protein n=1 Tax=Capnocytophaga bilenii TaxID=2819369 RepID=UPI0028D8F05D|nr:hypothetical protein [Capnocytophaga bilenii]
MIKRILLLVIAAISFAACSKSDKETPNSEKGGNDKLLGTWVGTVQVIAEKPEKKTKVDEIFKQMYGIILGSPETNYEVYSVKVVFSNIDGKKNLKITDKNGVYTFQDITYDVNGNKITDEDKKQNLATFSFDNNKLLAENTDFFYLLVDSDAIGNNGEYKKELEKLNKEYPNLPSLSLEKQAEYAEKNIILQLKYDVSLRYKYKYNLTRQ